MTTTGARRYINPHQRDVLVLLESSAESREDRTLADLEVLPGGRVARNASSPTPPRSTTASIATSPVLR